MSLFVINRYEGEKGDEVKDERKHLSELLKRIEERKLQRETGIEDFEIEKSQFTDELVHKKRRKKEKKSVDTNEVEITENINNQNNEVTKLNANTAIEAASDDQPKRKKKKIKHKSNSVDNTHKQHEALENEETIANDIDATGNELKESNDITNAIGTQFLQPPDFMILGEKAKKKKREVRRVLPDWLARPEIVSIDLHSGPSLEELTESLDSKQIDILRKNGFTKLFPVQASMMTWMLRCSKERKQGWWVRDTCVSAPTGSGKTLAYVLPVVQELQNRLVPKIRCLVVVPVQELALQVYKVMVTYSSHTNLVVGLLSGASSFEQEQNSIIKKTSRGEYVSKVDIVVTTPGRLIDHILKTPGFCLNDLKFLVIDEADRAAEWLQYLPEPHFRAPPLTLKNLKSCKAPAQKLLFSATLSQDPEKLNRLGLFHPILFTSVVISNKDEDVNLDHEVGDFIGRYTSPEELTELAIECSPEYKPLALYCTLTKKDIPKTLVFTNSGQTAHRLAILLQSFLSEKNIVVCELSAHLGPKQREAVLKKFSDGEAHVLVSSDALARGVDIPDIQMVISYDLPKHIKGYIHRAGRTGRAGKSGTAVSILSTSQVKLFRHMLTNAHKTVPEIEKVDLDPIVSALNYQQHVEKLKEILEKEKRESLEKTKAAKRV